MSFSIENFLIVLIVVIVVSVLAMVIYDQFGNARYRWMVGGWAMPGKGATASELGPNWANSPEGTEF